MKTTNYREVASEIVEVYLTKKEIAAAFTSDGYAKGYEDAVKMVLNVMAEKEAVEVKNFYRFSKVLK